MTNGIPVPCTEIERGLSVADRHAGPELPRTPRRFRVLIAGGGPAGMEAALALKRLAGDRIVTTLLTPEEELLHLPMTVFSPFAAGAGDRLPLAGVASDAGVNLRRGAVAAVDVASHEVRTSEGRTIGYDALLLATGAVQQVPYRRALAFGYAGTDERMHGLIQDVESGYVKRIAFVLPPGASWPLPLYELALMTADRAFEMSVAVELAFVTPEAAPLALFGPEAAGSIAELLDAAGIKLWTSAQVAVPECNVVELRSHGERLRVDRVVTLPVPSGPSIDGIPCDAAGFVPVDRHGRVIGAPDVYAAGDATDFEIKQGGIACQQADAAAESIAASAGVAIEPAPFAPVLRGVLLTERGARWMQRDLNQAAGDSSDLPPLWWPPTKIAGRELSRHLRHVRVHPYPAPARGVEVDRRVAAADDLALERWNDEGGHVVVDREP